MGKRTGLPNPSDRWGTNPATKACRTCMYFVNFRCRRNAPTLQGYPAVFSTDFCGEHKISKEGMAFMSEEE